MEKFIQGLIGRQFLPLLVHILRYRLHVHLGCLSVDSLGFLPVDSLGFLLADNLDLVL